MCNPITTQHPEVLLAKGEAYGFQWEVTSNRMGYRCGYVRVPPGHPWHGKDYSDVGTADGGYIEVHGGLTFAAPDTDCGKGGADNAWWVGFDCAHYGDAPDPDLPGSETMLKFGLDHGTVKTTEYVSEECRNLARQAQDANFPR
jgi:hypothetical protein